MKYILLVHRNEETFAKMPEATQRKMLEESIRLTHQPHNKGQYLHASPLHPCPTAALVRVRDGKPTVTDGPFIETREQLAGYFLVDVKDRHEAVSIADLVPGARIGTVEVRPLREIQGLPGE